MRLTAVFDEGEVVPFGDRGERRHVRRLTVQVYG